MAKHPDLQGNLFFDQKRIPKILKRIQNKIDKFVKKTNKNPIAYFVPTA